MKKEIFGVCVCCRTVVDEAAKALRNAAGNYYVNDKSTGSIVAQQPFGGARASGKTKRHCLVDETSRVIRK